MKKRQWIAFVMMLAMLAAMVAGRLPAVPASAASPTGVGLAEHALSAYYSGWRYRYGASGQSTNGVVYSDCSGLIYSYAGGARSSGAQISSASESGPYSTLPRIHGLGLWQPGHVGVYVGGGMAVDCRDTSSNTVYEAAGNHNWQKWYKVPGVAYPTTGWVTFNGQSYYYENGQYVVNCTKTIDGVSYTFNASGLVTSGNAPSGGTQAPMTTSATVQQSAPQQSASTGGSTAQTQTQTQAAAQPTYQDLGLDSKGAAVTRLQTRLSELDYYYEGINDYYDQMVKDAVYNYQKAAGLEATGIADVETQKSLFSSSAPLNEEPGTIYPGYHSSIVRQLQERLIELGYMEGETSFFYGEATKAAVLAYQKAAGMEENGILTMEQQNQIYSDDAIPAPAKEEPAEEEESQPAAAAAVETEEDGAAAKARTAVETESAPAEADPEMVSSLVESVSSTAEMANELFVQNVAAATKNPADASSTANGSGVAAFSVVILCAMLTTTIFVARKSKRTVKELAVLLVERFKR